MWVEKNADAPIVSGAQHGETMVDVPTNLALTRATVTRTILTLIFDPGGVESVGESFRVDYGICILSSDEIAAMVLPEPSGVDPDTPNSGWLLRDMRQVSVVSSAQDPRQETLVTYDLKSQRILRQGQTMQLIVNMTNVSGSVPMTLHMMSRVLVRLS